MSGQELFYSNDPKFFENLSQIIEDRFNKYNKSRKELSQIFEVDLTCSPELAIYSNIEEKWQSLGPSTFIPSGICLYYILHKMDSIIAQTHKFITKNINWHPYVSRIYYGVIFFIQTLRCQRAANDLNHEELLFLQEFERAFSFERLPIAGPLIAYFKSLSMSRPSIGYPGYVYPKLPQILGPSQLSAISHPQNLDIFLPNIPFLIGAATRYCSPTARARYEAGTAPWPICHIDDLTQITSSNSCQKNTLINGVLFDDTKINHAWLLKTPGLSYSCESNILLDEKFSKFGNDIGFPKFTPSSPLEKLIDFLGFSESMNWFINLIAPMQMYANFFNASGYLSECSPAEWHSAQVMMEYKTIDNLPCQTMNILNGGKTTGKVVNAYDFDFTFSALLYNSEVTPIEIHAAYYSQINILLPSNHRLASVNQIVRTGPYWTYSVRILKLDRCSGHLLIAALIRRFFIKDN